MLYIIHIKELIVGSLDLESTLKWCFCVLNIKTVFLTILKIVFKNIKYHRFMW